MKWFRAREKRAQPPAGEEIVDQNINQTLLRALLGKAEVTREDALQIPAVQYCINLISGTIISLPVRLYEKKDGNVEEIPHDARLDLLNKDTKDTMSAADLWGAVIEDIFLGKGAFVYINRVGNTIRSLHHVDNRWVSISHNTDPIFKDYSIHVNGKEYMPYEFLKIFRRTINGYENESILKSASLILGVVKNSLIYEDRLVQKGGNKKGFLQSENKLSDGAITALKEAFRNLYSNNEENVVVLNSGIKFQESSNTSVEMQLNENKKTNGQEIGRLMGVPAAFLGGNPTEKDCENLIKQGIVPVLTTIEAALNRDLLLEKEKSIRYFAFDTKELTRANIKERYEAYQIALKNNFMQIDEVRAKEDMEALGLEWITLGLNQVLYNPKTGEIYTPNTNKLVKKDMEGSEENAD